TRRSSSGTSLPGVPAASDAPSSSSPRAAPRWICGRTTTTPRSPGTTPTCGCCGSTTPRTGSRRDRHDHRHCYREGALMAASTHSFNFAGPHHKQRHAAGGEDEITPADIGAVAEDDPRIGDAGALLEAATTAAVNANHAASTATAAAERAESAEAAAFAEPDEAVAAMVENTTSDTRGAIDGLIDAAVPDLSGYPSREEVADGYVAAADVDEDVSGLIGDEQSQTRQALDHRLPDEYPSKGDAATTYLIRAKAPIVHTGEFTIEVVDDFRATATYSFPDGMFDPDGHVPVVSLTPTSQFYSASATRADHAGVTITV